ncbi:hypothetical protein C2845_PM14G00650 [Panicum miliaceum]|uniref:Uncharacterized protein n=1 Tax=Panicum miliaceum TaxID=4540 RepID=A0A3L6PSK3_PANMI|nr:hypothetical protein C2845_PM14G00650 [Panicum miliaceum]
MAGVPAPLPLRLHFDTLDQALRMLVEAPSRLRPYYADFHRVRVRDAAAIVALLELSTREAARKGALPLVPKVTNIGALEHFASAAGLLFLLDETLLPALLIEPCMSQPLIEALGDSGRELRVKAAAVGGTFETQVGVLCDLIQGYCEATPVQRPHGLMANWVQAIITRVKTIFDTTFTITKA